MFSTLGKTHASEKREIANACPGQRITAGMMSSIEETWSKIKINPDDESGAATSYKGLVVYALDISGSMRNIKDCLAKSVDAVMQVMKVTCPGVAQTVVTYADFDSRSLEEPPVIHAPFSLDWTHDDISKFLYRTEVKGGGYLGSETFDVALNYILRELVPKFHALQKCDDDDDDGLTPVLIFNLTDEDVRLRDETGSYGTVRECSPKGDNYRCGIASEKEETANSTWFYKRRWDVDVPLTAPELKSMLVEKNCWLRCISYSRDKCVIPPGYLQLCKTDKNFGPENERWQFFMSQKECTYEPILRMLVKHEWCFFNNLLPLFSASTVVKNVDLESVEEFVRTSRFRKIKKEWNINRAQIEDLIFRIENPSENYMMKLNRENALSSEPHLLVNAFDRALSLSPFCREQQSRASYVVDNFNSGGNVASCTVSFFNSVSEKLTEDDVAQSEFGQCQCKGCLKILEGVKNKKLNKDFYIRVQLGRYLAKALFEPMIGNKAMLCASAALEHVVGSIYDCAAKWSSSSCLEVAKILSKFKNHDTDRETPETSTCISSDSRKLAYELIKSSRSAKNVHYDAAHAISRLIEMKCEERSDKEEDKGEDAEDHEEDLIIWLYLNDRENVCKKVKGLIDGVVKTPEEFVQFELPECFQVVKILAANMKVTESVADIPRPATALSSLSDANTQFLAIPVSAIEENSERRNRIISLRAEKYFGGDKDSAAHTFVPSSSALQTLTNLVDTKYGLTVKGYSGVKSVAAAVSSRVEDALTQDLFARLGREALKSFVLDKRGSYSDLTTEEMFWIMLGDGFEGSLVNNLSSSITLNHISSWAKKYREISEDFFKKIEHFISVRYMAKMERNGINKGFKKFAVKELAFDQKEFFECDTCGVSVLEHERFGGSGTCVRCIRNDPERVEKFIWEKIGIRISRERQGEKEHVNVSLPLKFSKWKLTIGADVDIKKGEKRKASDYEILIEKMKSSDKKVRVAAANEIIKKQLNQGELYTNVEIALRAVKESDAVHKGAMVYDLLKKRILNLPGAVSLECSSCKSVYKASLLAPSRKQNRLCPWCRAGKKVKNAGKAGFTLLSSIIEKKNEISGAQFLWVIDECLKYLKEDEPLDFEEKNSVDSFFEKMKENSTLDSCEGENKAVVGAGAGAFKYILKSQEQKIIVAGYGCVKIKSDAYEGGDMCTLQEKISWEDFNKVVCERLLGYRLDEKWNSWNDFFCAPWDNIWDFVFKAATAAQKHILEELDAEEDYISPASIAKFIKSIV